MNHHQHQQHHYRRRFEDVKHAFQHTVRSAIQELQEQHGFSHEHAVQAVLHELVQGIRIEDEMVFPVMKQHGLCWEDALRALAVSRAVEQLTQETHCTVTAVQQLTQRLQAAELWKHRGSRVQITSSRDVPRKTSQSVSCLQLNTLSSSQEIVTRTSDMLMKHRDKQQLPPIVESTSSLPIPAEITADFDITTTSTTSTHNNNNNIEEIKTKSSAAKTVARKPTTKPESNRKRAAKRSREHEEECSAKRSC